MVRVDLYINGTLIPLSEELSIPLNFQVADIQFPDKRKGAFSKTITIPRSKEIDQLFGYIFDLNQVVDSSGVTNFQPDFNPNLKAGSFVQNDGIDVFNGTAQLVDVVFKDRVDGHYDVLLNGKVRNLFDEIGDGLLRDLDFSEYDHVYNRTNITNSWATSIIKNGGSQAFAYGSGYVYDLIDRGFSTDLQSFPLTSFFPSIYAKEYWDKIFSDAGFTYTSTFLNSAFFKTLTIPFSSAYLRLDEDQITDRKFKATKTGTTTISIGVGSSTNTIVFDNDSTGGNFDTSGQYNNATGIFTTGASLNAVHTFNTQIRIGYTIAAVTPTGNTMQMARHISFQGRIRKQTAGGTITTIGSVAALFKHIGNFVDTYTTSNPSTGTNDFFIGIFNPENYINISVPNVDMQVGDKIYVEVFLTEIPGSAPQKIYDVTAGAYVPGTCDFHIYADSYLFNTVDNAQIVEGNTVLMNNAVPDKVKQKDFIMSITKMFNLYYEEDPDVSNKFRIEPRIDYYNNTVVDWSQKLDQNSELHIQPMGALDTKIFQNKYKSDTDYFNKKYQDSWKETYGERNIEVINDFVKGTKTTELIFSPTPSFGNASSDRVIPRIIKIDEAGVVSTHESNIRILQYGGVKTTNQVWYINDSSGANAQTTYPYSGMLDDPFNPTIDLGFGIPAEIYWEPIFDDIVYTNNNLFNKYWLEMVYEIIHPNSRLVSGMFKLSPIDIATLDFRKLYYFENEYFRLNKVIDYDPVKSDLTKCEFIRALTGIEFTGTTTTVLDDAVFLGTDSRVDGVVVVDTSKERLPVISKPRLANGSTARRMDSSGIDYGFGNRVGNGVKTYFITGNSNFIGDYCDSVSILDSSGVTVAGGCKNVTVIGAVGITVTESNVTVVRGQYYGRGSAVANYVAGNNTYDGSARVILCDCTLGDVNVLLPDVVTLTEPIYIKKVCATANNVVIDPLGAQLIDEGSTHSFSGVRQSRTIISDGTKWWIIAR